MQGALAPHYAHALADVVFAPNSDLRPEDAVRELRAVDELVSGSELLQRALMSPAVSKSRKFAIVIRLADEMGVHRKIRNFLQVLVSHRRTKELGAIRRSFEEVVDERLGWIPADISSPRELTPQQREQIEHALGTQLGKFIRAHYKVDPALIGGVRAQVASREYDATIRGRLESLRQRLAAV
jgi:F-type H+-transporting ATPase subunit delta